MDALATFPARDDAMPEHEDGWDSRPGSRRTPYEMLQILVYKAERFDQDLQGVRKEMERGREEFRLEVRERIDNIERKLIDPTRYAIVEKVVFGMAGIILVAFLTAAAKIVFFGGPALGVVH